MGGIAIGQKRTGSARQRRASKVKNRQRRLAREGARQQRRVEAEDAVGLMIDELSDELVTVVERTLDESDPEVARAFAEHLLATDQSLMAEGELDEEIGTTLAFSILITWLKRGGDDPGRTARATDWIGSHLGAEATELTVLGGDLVDRELDEAQVSKLLGELGDDLLPTLIWLVTAFVATEGGGDLNWLRPPDEPEDV